ncbi:hypothetical protein [Rhizobium sp. 2MFCol3.1]|uniref:DUF6894 family protein n=1 Tax=Rhizobium sp. 2MFCol3.1 TaxID=1246459 RepID=UPI0003663C92|nr:hypothetical protein [Rhizobium sp. 2MFCol3.1]
MPKPSRLQRFHFNIRKNGNLLIDRDGVLLPDIGDAIAEALLCAQLQRAPSQGGGSGRKLFEIMDGSGKLLATVPID